MDPRDRIRSLLTRLRRALPAIVLAVIGNFALARLGVLHGLEHWVLDLELIASGEKASNVVVVNISDADYDELFGARSPLDPHKLHSLIDAIAKSKPRIIGVDIETTHPDFRAFIIDPSWPPVLWERDVSTAGIGEASIEPLDILGAQNPTLNASSGIPILLDDPDDKVTRFYVRCIKTAMGPLPSFVHAAALGYNRQDPGRIAQSCRVHTDDHPTFIRYFLRDRGPLNATQLIALSAAQRDDDDVPFPALTDKLVLLGGSYRGLDRHFTPIGSQPGVLVLANAIETELNGGTVSPLPRWKLFALELVASAILVFMFHATSTRFILIFGLPAVLVFSFTLSAIVFDSSARFVNFAPMLLVVLAFEIYEHVRHKLIHDAFASHGLDKPTAKRRRSRLHL
jgi:CHASE2 domain-containing sensor protein